MSKIPTAEEVLLKNITEKETPKGHLTVDASTRMMIEFAKLHVKAALKEASKNATIRQIPGLGNMCAINKDSILNAYPLENIK